MRFRVPLRATPFRLFLSLVAGLLVVAVPSSSRADSRFAGELSLEALPMAWLSPEPKPGKELGEFATITLNHLRLGAITHGKVLLDDDDGHTVVNDAVVFDDMDRSASSMLIPGVLAKGNFLRAPLCGDKDEGRNCSGPNELIALNGNTSPIPEPGTLVLVGSGIVGSGIWRLRGWTLPRRFMPRER
jgi:hypothetical protein